MSQISPLKKFTNILVAFFEDLSESYPEEKDIRMAAEGLRGLSAINPKLILSMFIESVYPEFKGPVMARDEVALNKLAHNKLSTEFSQISYAYWIFDKHWKSMSESNKDKIWKYCTAIVLLAEKASSQ
jgi:hypothetical protein